MATGPNVAEIAREKFISACARRDGSLYGTPLRESYLERDGSSRAETARTFWGDDMTVVLPEISSCELHAYGLIEPGLTRAFLDLVSPGDVVYDVGAHYGYYTLLASHLGARVHAFEPSAATLEILRENVGDRGVIVPEALWRGSDELPLQDFGRDRSSLNTLVEPVDEAAVAENIENVPTIALDEYVADSGTPPTFIKIDAEGAELDILEGGADTIERHRPMVSVEVGDPPNDPTRSRRVLERAVELGYRPFDAAPEGLREHRPRATYDHGNVVLLPDASGSGDPG